MDNKKPAQSSQNVFRILKWFWEFSGLRFVYRKIRPHTHQEENASGFRKPSTFFLWFIGLWVASYGIASQKYENRLDRAESKLALLASQLYGGQRTQALERLGTVQNTPCPRNPTLLNLKSITHAIFSENSKCRSVVEGAQDILVANKDHLNDLTLNNLNLSGTQLNLANFTKSELFNTDLSSAKLYQAQFVGSIFVNVDFTDANLRNSNFKGAKGTLLDFTNANLVEADFTNFTVGYRMNGNLDEDELIKLLEKASSLYMAKGIPENVIAQLKKRKAELFEHPHAVNRLIGH
ncbi:pentapeptide repeat-containing protein [uncultured Pseudoteredinibacter sp.]|uniref:pentapeptide repeat-containing protein n=1 Tax=uncultured Pseudoteredinibacter sp. TaxID=1641701 RepID=UPI0026071F59|nr:pentapeptide repeat-containing protein [uncultured Pseudoteredinibacter sp.]